MLTHRITPGLAHARLAQLGRVIVSGTLLAACAAPPPERTAGTTSHLEPVTEPGSGADNASLPPGPLLPEPQNEPDPLEPPPGPSARPVIPEPGQQPPPSVHDPRWNDPIRLGDPCVGTGNCPSDPAIQCTCGGTVQMRWGVACGGANCR
jgi:hypothetical protein